MTRPRTQRPGVTLLVVSALVGFALALYAYVTPLTGVNGTLGALVVVIANVILALLGLLLLAVSGGARLALAIVVLIGLAGTGFAALLLHQWWIAVAMVVALGGLIASVGCPVGHDKSANA